MTEEQVFLEAQQLSDLLREITSFHMDNDLIRQVDLGAHNFSQSRDLFERVIRYAGRLRILSWERLPQPLVIEVRDNATNLRDALKAVQTFSLEEGNASARRDQTALAVEQRLDELLTVSVPFVGFLSWETLDIPAMQQQLTSVLTAARTQSAAIVEEATKSLGEKQTEAEEIVEAMRAASAERGVATYADAFREAAESHEKGAGWWLIISIMAAAITIAGTFILVIVWEANGDISDGSVLQVVLAKGTFLAIMAFVTFSFFRLHRSHVHMAETNRHRERAMKTFQTFTAATADPDTKNKVLLEATHAVFGHTSTGLIDGRESSIVEVLDAGATTMLRRND